EHLPGRAGVLAAWRRVARRVPGLGSGGAASRDGGATGPGGPGAAGTAGVPPAARRRRAGAAGGGAGGGRGPAGPGPPRPARAARATRLRRRGGGAAVRADPPAPFGPSVWV